MDHNGRKIPAMYGRVTPPDDLGPAIAALGEIGKAWLARECAGREIEPADIARAADYERGDLNDE